MPDRMDAFTAAYAVSSAAVVVELSRMLAEQGLLSPSQVELLRHSALLGFDQAREQKELSAEVVARLEAGREHLEEMWGRVVRAAEASRRG